MPPPVAHPPVGVSMRCLCAQVCTSYTMGAVSTADPSTMFLLVVQEVESSSCLTLIVLLLCFERHFMWNGSKRLPRFAL